jgi:hypothetical protein
MAWWLEREKRMPVVIVELQEEATQRVVRRESQQARRAEPAVPCLAVEKPPARGMLRRALFAQLALRSGRLERAFSAPGRQL